MRIYPKVLFERHAGIGDLICTFPSVIALKDRHPDATFVYGVWPIFKSIVEMSHVANSVIEIGPNIKYQDYDYIYQPKLEDESPCGREFVHLVDDFAQTIGVTPISRQPKLYIPFDAFGLAKQLLTPLRKRTKYIIGIHIGPSWPVREWTIEGWTNLVKLLHDNLDCIVIQLGADVNTAKGFVKSPRILGSEDFVGKMTLEESVAVINQIDLFVGIDSGLLHVAGAVSTPSVGLFGPVNPKLRLPPETPSIAVVADIPCVGCHHKLPRLHWQEGCPNNIICMKSIRPDHVFKAIFSLIK